jgi:ribosomal protein S18 acetylase RimI-like enzyme
MDIRIRRLTFDDAAILHRVAVDVFDEPVNAKRLAAYLAEPGHLMIVALAGDEVVAQCAAVIHRHPDKPTELYIDEIGVAPTFRRQGIARQLLDEMFALGARHWDVRRLGSALSTTTIRHVAFMRPVEQRQSRS